tara:strand:- start:153 stop:740 length:588 start_codon:yes stop_codon:yes gene_type:complete
MSEFDYKIISISGNARVGKDTMGNNLSLILAEFGIKTKTLSFANELKESVNKFLVEQTGISAFTDDDNEKSTIRPFLVCWGTDIMRKIDNKVWINKLENNLEKDCVNIITDLRFTNELEWLKENKGFSIMLDRQGVEPANTYEVINNSEMSNNVDLNFSVGNFEDKKLLELTAVEILDKLINKETFDLWKATCPL